LEKAGDGLGEMAIWFSTGQASSPLAGAAVVSLPDMPKGIYRVRASMGGTGIGRFYLRVRDATDAEVERFYICHTADNAFYTEFILELSANYDIVIAAAANLSGDFEGMLSAEKLITQ